MSQLDDIEREGTRNPDFSETGKPSNHVACADGFTASVIAGIGTYCLPRPGGYGWGAVPRDYAGPYTHAEVGFPSERPEPWAAWEAHCESPDDPTGTIYSRVPFQTIRDLIELHGGIA